MDNIINIVNRLMFQMRWVFMSPERRYAYLWNKTDDHYKYHKY